LTSGELPNGRLAGSWNNIYFESCARIVCQIPRILIFGETANPAHGPSVDYTLWNSDRSTCCHAHVRSTVCMILPKAPDTGTVASKVPPPLPDARAAKDLQEQQAAAHQTEADVKRESASGPAGGSQ
jgi:hypothetical protein